ncbi:MAG: trypsin-like peptidase domain-containing protein [bacterium]|nr:trypsin-like peptidase domain-containing protein [bacterium]
MAEALKSLSDSMADTVEQASASVVRVEGRKRLAATGIVWSADGVIVTAHHVLRRDDDIKIALPDGSLVNATLVGRDPNTDLAVLRAPGSFTGASLAPVDQSVRVGNLVLALGRPTDRVQATLGIVSAIGSGQMEGAIQTDVVMYPGFSGGPLVDASGYVRGMNTSGFMRGVSITVSTEKINEVVNVLLQHGKMKQGFLGVGLQPVRLQETLIEQVGQETGLMLASVEKGSPAEAANVYQGDIIVRLDGVATRNLDELLALLNSDRVGKSVPVTIIRSGQVHDLSITIGEKQ